MSHYESIYANDRYDSPDYIGLLQVLKRFGLFALGGMDGCLCTGFEFRSIAVLVSCRKSEGGHCPDGLAPYLGFHGNIARVHCCFLGALLSDLIPIAQEAARQLLEAEPHLPVLIRLCNYAHDHDNPTGLCLYCGEPRSRLANYLCDECGMGAKGSDVIVQFTLPSDWSGLVCATNPNRATDQPSFTPGT